MITLDDIAKKLDRLEKATVLNKAVLTIAEVALLTGYTVKYLRLLIAQHDIPYYRRGNRIYFNRAEVENWMMEQRIPSNEEIKQEASRRINNKLKTSKQ
jgi:excisionase family DNA binding protein